MKWNKWKKLIITIAFLAGINYVVAQDINPKTTQLSQKVIALIKQYISDIEIETRHSRIHIYYNTRNFMVHRPYKTGKWQNAREETGPEMGGLAIYFSISNGPLSRRRWNTDFYH